MKKNFLVFILSAWLMAGCGGNGDEKELKQVSADVFDEQTRIELNDYFTQILKAGISPADSNAFTDEALIGFGVNYLINTDPASIMNVDEYTSQLSKEKVDSAIFLFFGKKIQKPVSVYEIQYEGGYFTFPKSEGGEMRFAQTQSLKMNADSTFTAILINYIAGSGACVDINADPASWPKDDAPENIGRVRATLRKSIVKSVTRYVLLDYRPDM